MFFFVVQGELPPLAEVDEILTFIEKIGVDQVALDGGFVAPDLELSESSGSGAVKAATNSAEKEGPSSAAAAAAVGAAAAAPVPTT